MSHEQQGPVGPIDPHGPDGPGGPDGPDGSNGPAESKSQATKMILVVDDDREIAEMTRLILAGDGYGVDLAGSGSEALERIALKTPDVVLLDVNMPGMDGWEVLRLLQADEATRRLPVVMFSVKMQVRDKVHALQEGAYDYITKPFAPDELLQRLRQIIDSLEVAS